MAEALAVAAHLGIVAEGGPNLVQDARGVRIGRNHDAVVHPQALAAGGDNAGAAQISEVAGNFGLIGLQDFDEIADAEFGVAHEVQEAKAGAIGQRAKQGFEWHRFGFRVGHIYSS